MPESDARMAARPDAGPDGRTGLDMRALAWGGVAIVVMLVLALGGAYLAWRTWAQASSHPAPNTTFDLRIDGPLLESAPQDDRAAYMTSKEKLLHSYEWVDRQAGIARIPIDQAMRMLAENAARQPDSRHAPGRERKPDEMQTPRLPTPTRDATTQATSQEPQR